MLQDFSTAVEGMSAAQYLVALFGGYIFGLAVYYIRPRGVGVSDYIVHYNNYILSALLMFYVTFPFAQGLLGLLEDGSAVRLISVSLTYLVYVIGFIIASCTYWFASKGKR